MGDEFAGFKTIVISKARKDVICSKGTPECETDKVKFTLLREDVKNKGKAGEITVFFAPDTLANQISLRKVSGPMNKVADAGPIPCALCTDLSISTPRTRAMDFLLAPDIKNLSDEEFEKKRFLSKQMFLQSDMNHACKEYMGGDRNGLELFYKAANFAVDCRAPQVVTTGSLKATVKLSLKVYWFGSNCKRSEMTLTSDGDGKSFNIKPRKFSLPTLRGGQLGPVPAKGDKQTRYDIEYDCPNYRAKLFCGTCFYEQLPDEAFLQPKCIDVDAAGTTLGALADLSGDNKFDENLKPFNPFKEVQEARDAISKEIEEKLPALIQAAADELVAKALEMSASKTVNGESVCALGYELSNDVDIQYTIR